MAKVTIRFANSAREELEEILGFIALDNPQAAAKLSLRIEKSIGRLADFPASGRLIPEEPGSPAREIVIPPIIRVFYRVEGQVVRILHFMRGEHSFPPLDW
ncbi:MAG: type II toxin-antitoxin system RelE/ParE family toxin [Holophaga sp.]|nr:type II toxin-antitoxin system RelE/ParE family toxin [Holophaga sp.]